MLGQKGKERLKKCLWRFQPGFKVYQQIGGMQEEETVERSREKRFTFKHAEFLEEHPGSAVMVNV